mmetsp:Transcript_23334/g.81331  ORF Transcript_23334/g.81331 Transcript_23334/m.81331 type:complete len:208 (-) Transcript_23334:350-973(-)
MFHTPFRNCEKEMEPFASRSMTANARTEKGDRSMPVWSMNHCSFSRSGRGVEPLSTAPGLVTSSAAPPEPRRFALLPRRRSFFFCFSCAFFASARMSSSSEPSPRDRDSRASFAFKYLRGSAQYLSMISSHARSSWSYSAFRSPSAMISASYLGAYTLGIGSAFGPTLALAALRAHPMAASRTHLGADSARLVAPSAPGGTLGRAAA